MHYYAFCKKAKAKKITFNLKIPRHYIAYNLY